MATAVVIGTGMAAEPKEDQRVTVYLRDNASVPAPVKCMAQDLAAGMLAAIRQR